MISYLFDTNILVDHLRKYKSILPFVRKCQSQGSVLRISAITWAEIQAGQSINNPLQTKRAKELFSVFELISLDTTIADKAGALKRKYNLNLIDAIIAATAILADSTLITRNIRHFQNIPDLKIKSAF